MGYPSDWCEVLTGKPYKAYGNSIIPQVAAVVMRAIMAREKEAKRE
jgi:hypothetical protein